MILIRNGSNCGMQRVQKYHDIVTMGGESAAVKRIVGEESKVESCRYRCTFCRVCVSFRIFVALRAKRAATGVCMRIRGEGCRH